MPRRTKIVATLGPATDKKHILDEMIQAGMDVVRVNFSHGTHEDHITRAENVRNRARAHGHQVGVLADLQGPKIRIERFREGMIRLEKDDHFILDAGMDADAGTRERVGVTYKTLPNDVSRGDTLLIDDGLLVLWVEEVSDFEVRCRVLVGGKLTNSKGLNRLGGGLSAAAMTSKDREDIKVAASMGADYVAISFPRSADDILEARELLREAGGHGGIVAKIERAEALDSLEEIIEAADAVMIARGDLGVEIGDAELPAVALEEVRPRLHPPQQDLLVLLALRAERGQDAGGVALGRLLQGRTQGRGIVVHHAQIGGLQAEPAEHAEQGVSIAVVDLARAQGLSEAA